MYLIKLYVIIKPPTVKEIKWDIAEDTDPTLKFVARRHLRNP